MSDAIKEKVILEASSPKPSSLAGLDAMLRGLAKMDTYIRTINAGILSLGNTTLLRRSAKEFEAVLNLGPSKPSLKAEDVAKRFGLDANAFQTFLQGVRTQGEKARREFTEAFTGGSFRSAGKAGVYLERYFADAARGYRRGLNAIFSAGLKPTEAQMNVAIKAAKVIGTIPLEIPASQIQARVSGVITAVLPAGGGGAAAGAAAGGAAPFTPGGPGGPGRGKTRGKAGTWPAAFQPPAAANELSRTVIQTADAAKTIVREATALGETVSRTYDEVGDLLRQEQRTQRGQALATRLQQQKRLFQQAMRQKAAALGAGDYDALAALKTKAATQLEGLLTPEVRKELGAQFSPLADLLGAQAGVWRGQAEGDQLRAADQSRRRRDRGDRRLAAVREQAARADAQRRERLAQEAARASALVQAEAAAQMTAQQGRLAMEELLAGGYQLHSQKSGERLMRQGGQLRRRSTESYTLRREEGGMVQARTVTFEFDAAGKAIAASMSGAQRAIRATRAEGSAAARNLIQNTAHITAWAASVGTLYSALGVAKHSLTSLLDVGKQTARLGVVFQGVGGTATQLRDDVLALAAANGRSTDEAMESAVAWSRLGLNKAQATEAVRASLVAANVAEMDAATAGRHLMAIMTAYQLQVGELGSKLGELNAISNTWNVTNKDMLEGIGRTAAVAKQAGIPLEELMGIIAAGVGTTGQTGVMFGNAVKSLTIALSKPDTQQFLRGFNIETRQPGGEIKTMSEILRELFTAYQQLTNAERQHLLVQVAGKTQASRVAAMMDSYVRAQVLAINAQMNLNSAEAENIKIKQSLRAQLQGIVTEWDKLVTLQGNRGPVQAMSATAGAFRNVLSVLNLPGANQATTALLGLGTVVGARMLMSAASIKNEGKLGFLGSSMVKGREVATGLRSLMATEFMGLFQAGGYLDRRRSWVTMDPWSRRGLSGLMGYGAALKARGEAAVQAGAASWDPEEMQRGRQQYRMGQAVRGAATAMAFTRTYVAPVAAALGAMTTFNWSMEQLGRHSESADRKLAGVNHQLEATAARAKAADQAIRLLGTLQNSLTHMTPKAAGTALGALAQLGGLPTADRHALGTAMRGGRMEEARAILERAKGVYYAERETALSRRSGILLDALSQAEARRDMLAASPTASAEERWKYEQLSEQLSGDITDNLLEQLELTGQLERYEDRRVLLAERYKLTMEAVAQIYQDLPTIGALDKHAAGKAASAASIQFYQEREAALEQEKQAIRQRNQAAQTQIDADAQQLDRLRQAAPPAMIAGPSNGMGPGSMVANPAYEAHARRLAEMERDLAARRQAAGGADTMELTRAQQDLRDARRREERRLNDLNAMDPWMRLRAAGEAGRSMARARLSEFDVGETEAERVGNRIKAIPQLMSNLENARGDTQEQKLAAANQLLQYQLELATSITRQYELQHQLSAEEANLIREKIQQFNKSLITAGPGELLKRLAALQLGKTGVNTGQFFSLAPELREMVSGMPVTENGKTVLSPFDPDRGKFNRARGALGAPVSESDYLKSILSLQEQSARFMAQMAGLFADMSSHEGDILTNLAETSKNLGVLSTSAVAASQALDLVAASAAGRSASLNPQSRGAALE